MLEIKEMMDEQKRTNVISEGEPASPSLIPAAVRWCSCLGGWSHEHLASECCSSRGWRSPSQQPEL